MTEKEQKMVHTVTITYSRPRNDRKGKKKIPVDTIWFSRPPSNRIDQKNVPVSPYAVADLAETEKTRKWFLLSSCGAKDLVVTKDHKMVPAVTMWCGTPLLSPCAAEDLTVIKRPENGPCCRKRW